MFLIQRQSRAKQLNSYFYIYFCKNILSSSIEVKSNIDYIHNYNVLSEVIMVSRYVKEKEQLSLQTRRFQLEIQTYGARWYGR